MATREEYVGYAFSRPGDGAGVETLFFYRAADGIELLVCDLFQLTESTESFGYQEDVHMEVRW